MEIQIEEVVVEEASALAGKTIKDADIRAKNWVVIVVLKKKNGKILFNPRAHTHDRGRRQGRRDRGTRTLYSV